MIESMDRTIKRHRWKQLKSWLSWYSRDLLQVIMALIVMNLLSIEHAILFLLVGIFAKLSRTEEIYGIDREEQ